MLCKYSNKGRETRAMMKYCGRCGKFHDFNYRCKPPNNSKHKDTQLLTFRNSNKWKRKRNQIQSRDKGLCQVCVRNLYDTNIIYNFNLTSVHHIEKLVDNFDLRLEDDNLITLCSYHHKMADDGEISVGELKNIIEDINNNKQYPPYLKGRKR